MTDPNDGDVMIRWVDAAGVEFRVRRREDEEREQVEVHIERRERSIWYVDRTMILDDPDVFEYPFEEAVE